MFTGGGKRGPARRGVLLAAAALIMAALAAVEMLDGDGPTPPPEGAAARRFDYYVLALSWSPSFCAEHRDADQCGKGRGFLLHGLWPNLENGWETDCPTDQPRPSRALLARYAPISAGPGLLAYEWRTHGACTGLAPDVYFQTAADAYAKVKQPRTLERLDHDLTLDPKVIEDAFLEANPGLSRDGVTVRCQDGRFTEVQVCLTPELEPRACGAKTSRDCGANSVALPAPK